MSDWKFGDNFPSIEIDTEYWKTLSAKDRIKYIGRLLYQDKGFGDRINLMQYIMNTTAKVGKAFLRDKEVIAYLDILEQSTNLIAVSAAVGNIFKAKQKFKSTKNNEIAKLMGFPNGNYVDDINMEVTHAMIEGLLEISDFHKEKYDIAIDSIVDDNDKEENKEEKSLIKTFRMAGTIDGDIKWGMTVKSIASMGDDQDTTTNTTCRLFHPVTGMKIHPDELRERLMNAMLEIYVERIDSRRNFIVINGTRLDVKPRVEITEEIMNLDINRIARAMNRVHEEEARHGWVLVGEPGVGKTIAVHKLINQFPDKLTFWVSPDSINSVHGIRNTFKIFKMFKNSIVIFDDLDSGPFTVKDEITNELLRHLDAKNNKDLTGCYLATVNDPSKVHMTLINRPERFDEVIHVLNPSTHKEVSTIFFNKARERGYYSDKEYKKAYDAVGKIKFTAENEDFKKIVQNVIEAKFTQNQVAGLINYCHLYSNNKEINLELLEQAVKNQMNNDTASNLKAVKGRLVYDREGISEEARANLVRH